MSERDPGVKHSILDEIAANLRTNFEFKEAYAAGSSVDMPSLLFDSATASNDNVPDICNSSVLETDSQCNQLPYEEVGSAGVAEQEPVSAAGDSPLRGCTALITQT